MRANHPEPGSAARTPHLTYQIDRSFGPPMVYIDGDRRDRPPLITINVAHEHELLITDEQARALRAALDEVLSPAHPRVVFAGHDESLKATGDRQWTPVQTSAATPPAEQHSIEDQVPRLFATADDLHGGQPAPAHFGKSAQWLCACRWVDGQCWRAVGPTDGWLVFASIERFYAWCASSGATWDRWARP